MDVECYSSGGNDRNPSSTIDHRDHGSRAGSIFEKPGVVSLRHIGVEEIVSDAEMEEICFRKAKFFVNSNSSFGMLRNMSKIVCKTYNSEF